MNNGVEIDTPITTLAYLVSLVESPEHEIANLKTAKFVLELLFSIEEQVANASELLSLQEKNLPKAFFPQTPVMLARRWSPISALLEQGFSPLALAREVRVPGSRRLGRMACASGIWRINSLRSAKGVDECVSPEELFWHVLKASVEKANKKNLLLSIIAQPGWSYEDNIDRPQNLTLLEAEKADRVIWQRTPRVKAT